VALFARHVITIGLCCLCLQGCASTRNRAVEQKAQVVSSTYDEAWQAVEALVLTELGCAAKKLDAEDGYLETEWVHKIEPDGVVRWRIIAELKQTKQGVRVKLDKQMQLKDSPLKNLDRYGQEKKDTAGQTGWGGTEADFKAIDDLYQRLAQRLLPPPAAARPPETPAENHSAR